MLNNINCRTLICLATLSLSACQPQPVSENSTKTVEVAKNNDVLEYVDPFIGTGGHGHTFPGATVPWGMVQLSPDNPSKGWDWTSGYNYSDSILLGFSHTHLSGTGVGDLLDILVTPFRSDYPANVLNGAKPSITSNANKDPLLYDEYSHADEHASAGYYSVKLKHAKVTAELTASARVGVHRYTFEGDEKAQLLFNLGYAQNHDKTVKSHFQITGKNTLVGYRFSSGWAKQQPVYFAAEFSQTFSHQFYHDKMPAQGEAITGVKTEAVLTFIAPSKPVVVKVGISYASIEGALANIALEVPHLDFDLAKQQAEQRWRTELNKIQVKDQSTVNKTKFYTALYHSFIAPHLFSDAKGEYYGANGKTQKAQKYDRYTLFSLWDTFRALHPLLTITHPKQVDPMVKSMLAFYDEAGLLPTWDLMSNETDVMIGYHAVPVLVDAYFKGLTTVDPHRILEAIKKSAMQDRFGIDLFKKYGYIPSELEVEAVSKTLEYAFDDWAIARLAKHLGEEQDYVYFSQRANSYRTLFDASVGFMRGKDAQGNWVQNFSPTHVDHRITDYTEANAWQYTWFVPHDVSGLMALFGGEQPFIKKLDELFETSSKMEGDVSPDISGLIGQYAHGNEPCHHIPYLYSFTNQKWKGEQRIKQIRQSMYRADPDGLAGNDDVGQMSAWYVFSALGFYPVNPADGKYVLGTPLFDQVDMLLDNGKTFTIKKQQHKETAETYVKQVQLNGKKLDTHLLQHSDLIKGGELIFEFE